MTERLLDGRGVVVPATLLAAALAYAAALSPLIALAGLGAALLLVLVLVWAEAVLLLLVAVLPWEDLLAYPTETVSAVKVLGLLLAGAWAVRALGRSSEVKLPATLAPVAVFGLLVGASLVLSPDPVAGLDKWLRYTLFIVFFFLVVQLTGDRASIRRFLRVLTLSTAGAAIWALAAFLGGELDRASGPIQDPNDFAYLMATVFPLAAFLFVEERGRRVLWGACLALMLGATLATLSRGALVGLAALAIWAVASRRVPIFGVLAGLVTLASVLLVALFFWSPLIEERVEQKGQIADRNATTRLAFWDAAARMAYDHPLVGVGPARFGEETDEYLLGSRSGLTDPVVHNSYLEIAAENGIPALLAFLAFLGGSATLLARARRASEEAGDAEGVRLATALQAAFVVALVSAAFLSQQLALPLWLVGALAVAIAARSGERSGAPEGAPAPLRALSS
jgi:putative inorganic carbon (hco3(-)) transporter